MVSIVSVCVCLCVVFSFVLFVCFFLIFTTRVLRSLFFLTLVRSLPSYPLLANVA